MIETAFIIFIAHIMDRLLGDPVYTFHPVRLIGKAIEIKEDLLRRAGFSGIGGGILLVTAMFICTGGAYLIIRLGVERLHPFAVLLLDTFITYSSLATGDLIAHAKPVADSLIRKDLVQARERIGKIVGRDASQLTSSAIARADIETLAENFVDGLLSPLFWFLTGGILGFIFTVAPCQGAVLGIILFKTSSTLDSMVGYRNEIYLKFGKASARMDDIMNFIPARISLVFLAISAMLWRLPVKEGIKNFFRHRLDHLSPNSAHAESFMSGILNLSLGGPSVYYGKVVQKPWIGRGTTEANPDHILLSCRVISTAADFAVLFVILIFWLLQDLLL